MGLLQISLIEDDPADVRLLRDALQQIGLRCILTVAVDGEEGVDCLIRRNKFEKCLPADLILLDMHLPKLTGLQILKIVPQSGDLPICMLTTCELGRPLVEAHMGRPVSYLIKPVDPEKLLDCLRRHTDFRPIAA
jgi:chemotaxis family two-component system response regulator Rcp1